MRIGIDADLDYLFDEQQRPAFLCPICGGEIYGDGICLRCERRREEDE